ncbi:MAG: trigger factor [Bacteroidia bacterium]
MNISKESIGECNEVVKILLKPEDYKEKVDATIKKTRRSVQIPGFRPGNVPEGMVRKMYGKSILLDELNKLVSESLNNFIVENKIDILGHPLPMKNGSEKNNFDAPADFEFSFELGLAPQFKLNLPPSHVFPYYEIQVDDAKVDTYLDDVRRRYGIHSTPEISDDKCVLYAAFTEIDAEGKPVEKGITTSTSLAIDLVKDEKSKEKLIGLKKDDVIVLNIVTAINDETEVGYMLNIPKTKVAEIKNNFELKIISVNKVEKADLNQELFDKVYGKDAVKSETEFREKLRTEISAMLAVESDRKLQHDIEDVLLDDTKISLPDNFLKRWLLDTNEKPITAEQVEQDYNAGSRAMKWRLIEGRIVKDNNIQVTKEEIDNFAKHLIVDQFAQYGNSFLTDEMIHDFTKRYLEKEENVRKIIESISGRKVFNHLKSIVKQDVKKVSYDEFIKIVKEHHHHH